MKKIFKGAIIILVLFSITQINAQTETINFTLTSEGLVTLGQDVNVLSTIVIKGDTLIWDQQVEETVNTNTFTIVSRSEDWDQKKSTGTITFNMVIEGYNSEFILTGEKKNLSAHLLIKMSSTEQKEVLFKIDTITYQ